MNGLQTWATLVVLTFLNVLLGTSGYAGAWVQLLTVLLIWAKGSLIIEFFMHLHEAPRFWQGVVHGWLVVVCAGIAGVALW